MVKFASLPHTKCMVSPLASDMFQKCICITLSPLNKKHNLILSRTLLENSEAKTSEYIHLKLMNVKLKEVKWFNDCYFSCLFCKSCLDWRGFERKKIAVLSLFFVSISCFLHQDDFCCGQLCLICRIYYFVKNSECSTISKWQ